MAITDPEQAIARESNVVYTSYATGSRGLYASSAMKCVENTPPPNTTAAPNRQANRTTLLATSARESILNVMKHAIMQITPATSTSLISCCCVMHPMSFICNTLPSASQWESNAKKFLSRRSQL